MIDLLEFESRVLRRAEAVCQIDRLGIGGS
jgi:hypothetical protein